MQQSFSRLWDGFATDKEAKEARSLKSKQLKQQGYITHSFTLRNQLKPYDGFGIPNGGICNVYILDYKK